MSERTDKEIFLKEWQNFNLKYPKEFGIASQRYVRYLANMDRTLAPELKITPLQIEILKMLSKEPNKWYFSRDIKREMDVGAVTRAGTEIKILAQPLTTLWRHDYVNRTEYKPYQYQINVNGLKFLNQVIGDYDD